MEKKEGVPISAILAELDKKNITLSLIRAGKIVHTQSSVIEESIVKTTDKLLHFFTDYGILPSRIILLDAEEDNLNQEFISHPWSKSLPFLHFPQIETLPGGFDAQAVLSGAVSQMGFELLGETPDRKPLRQTQTQEEAAGEGVPQADKGNGESLLEKDSEDLGFIKEGDIAQINLDRSNISNISEEAEEKAIGKELPETKAVINRLSVKRLLTFSNAIFISLKGILAKMHLPSLPAFRKNKLFILPLVFALMIAIFVLYLLKASAKVILFVNPNSLEKTQNITFSPNAGTDFSKDIIHASPISVSETGSVSTNSTGTKEIGNKAKGSITIVSLLPNQQTFEQGTSVKSSNGLEFTTDSSITVASSSGATDPQTQKVNVTAKDIGKKYNLPSGTKFTIGSFDSSSAQGENDTPFSGGSKKEITVVSKNDYDKLLAELPKSLEDKAKKDIAQKVSPDMGIIPLLTGETVTAKYFDKNIGDQTAQVTLKATVSYQSLSYKKSDLNTFSLHLFQNRAQSETVTASGVSLSLKDIKENSDKTVSANLKATASLLPKINNRQLIEQIKGKPIQDATRILSKLPQVRDVSVKLSPALPLLPGLLPRMGRNIIIIIKNNE